VLSSRFRTCHISMIGLRNGCDRMASRFTIVQQTTPGGAQVPTGTAISVARPTANHVLAKPGEKRPLRPPQRPFLLGWMGPITGHRLAR
jgi:hypothetical protein